MSTIGDKPMTTSPFAFQSIGISLLLAFFIYIFLDPIAFVANILEVERIRRELPSAELLWKASNIQNYTIDVTDFVPLTCVYDATLTVVGGQLTKVYSNSNTFSHNSSSILLNQDKWNDGRCNYTQLVVSEMFLKSENNLSMINPFETELRVEFDPKYGYVSQYDYKTGVSHGVFGEYVSECCVRYKFSNFRPSAPISSH